MVRINKCRGDRTFYDVWEMEILSAAIKSSKKSRVQTPLCGQRNYFFLMIDLCSASLLTTSNNHLIDPPTRNSWDFHIFRYSAIKRWKHTIYHHNKEGKLEKWGNHWTTRVEIACKPWPAVRRFFLFRGRGTGKTKQTLFFNFSISSVPKKKGRRTTWSQVSERRRISGRGFSQRTTEIRQVG